MARLELPCATYWILHKVLLGHSKFIIYNIQSIYLFDCAY